MAVLPNFSASGQDIGPDVSGINRSVRRDVRTPVAAATIGATPGDTQRVARCNDIFCAGLRSWYWAERWSGLQASARVSASPYAAPIISRNLDKWTACSGPHLNSLKSSKNSPGIGAGKHG